MAREEEWLVAGLSSGAKIVQKWTKIGKKMTSFEKNSRAGGIVASFPSAIVVVPLSTNPPVGKDSLQIPKIKTEGLQGGPPTAPVREVPQEMCLRHGSTPASVPKKVEVTQRSRRRVRPRQ